MEKLTNAPEHGGAEPTVTYETGHGKMYHGDTLAPFASPQGFAGRRSWS